MKQATLQKMAEQDAYEWGIAEMFFGEGAGTRRKLISAKIDQKMHDIPGYAEAFSAATEQLNQLEMAEKAIAERKRIDRAAKASKNLRALRSGRLHQLSTGLYIAAGAVYLAHVTGYDKKIEAEARKRWAQIKEKRAQQKRAGDVYNVTNIRD